VRYPRLSRGRTAAGLAHGAGTHGPIPLATATYVVKIVGSPSSPRTKHGLEPIHSFQPLFFSIFGGLFRFDEGRSAGFSAGSELWLTLAVYGWEAGLVEWAEYCLSAVASGVFAAWGLVGVICCWFMESIGREGVLGLVVLVRIITSGRWAGHCLSTDTSGVLAVWVSLV
jgi:hypothetical protein